ncbi:hypothetical protein TIFTF001_049328 [Ficus carica]|uniref:Uncharacterized protein n=1 Tax=Ficus carica TaxID=3494 RepID=A0AA87Z6W1_FICCA|nr:hypothetical protein TIFTF001_049328 [Ficus carica]
MSSFFTSLFLLILIFTQEIIPSVDGRPFNLGKSNEPHLNETKIVGNLINGDNEESFDIATPSDGETDAPQALPPPPPGHETSDFRPTAPGHSPGVGHSVHN